MTYFYRYLSPFGTWRPATSPQKPTTQGPEGERRKVKDVTQVPPDSYGLSLTALDDAIASVD